MAPRLPTDADLHWATLEALKKLGGSASIQALSEHVTTELALTDEQLNVPHGNGPQSEVDYRAAWARTRLKRIGAVENTSRGVWAITEAGRRTREEEVRHRDDRAAGGEHRRRQIGAQAGEDVSLKDKSIAELLALHAALLEELRARGVLRTENNPTGDLAEYLFCAAYDWKRSANSEKAFDATGENGKRYQIKGRRLAGRNPSRQLSAIRDLDGFDVLAAVLFDGVYRILRAGLIPAEVVRRRSTYIAHTNSYKFMLQDNVWGEPSVIDATVDLQAILKRSEDWPGDPDSITGEPWSDARTRGSS